MNRICLILCLLSCLWLGCEQGQLLDNQPPDTNLFVDAINLSGENRLNTVVQLHWLGTDSDGYVVGYEIAVNEGEWGFTTGTDSVFRFVLTGDSDTSDIRIQIRAIDNENEADPTPDELIVPIKNSPPVARFDTTNLLPDTVLIVGSLLWNLSDVDGDETIDSVAIRINDGPWLNLVPNASFLTFLPESPTQVGAQSARILLGAGAEEVGLLEGLQVGGTNRIYLRAVDLSGSQSEIDTTAAFYVSPQTSDLLVVDEHGSATADSVYRDALDAANLAYDYFNLRDNIPAFWEPTFSLFLRSYDRVFWFGDGSNSLQTDEQLLLSTAGNLLQTYLNEGKKLFVTTQFPPEYNQPEILNTSQIFNFAPFDSLSFSPGNARLATGDTIYTVGEWVDRLDPLVSATFNTSADPFYPSGIDQEMMQASFIPSGGWTGPATVAARTRFNNGRTNQVFFSLELYRLNGDPDALRKLFDVILNEEFDW